MPPNGPRVHHLAGWMLWLAAALAGCSHQTTIPPEPPASVRRGDEAFRYEQYSSAIDAYRNYIDQTEQGAYTARAMYKTALAEYRLSHYRATLETLDDLSQRYPKGHWVQVEALRGDAERALGNTLAALQDWEKAWKLANDRDRQKLRKRIVTAAQDLSDADLARARRTATDEGFAALLDRQIAARQPPELNEPIPNASKESKQEANSEVANAAAIVEEPIEPVEVQRPKEVSATRKLAPPAPAEVEAPARAEVAPRARAELAPPPRGELAPPARAEAAPRARAEMAPRARAELEPPAPGELEAPPRGELEAPSRGELEAPPRDELEPPAPLEAELRAPGELEPRAPGQLEPPAPVEVEPPAVVEAQPLPPAATPTWAPPQAAGPAPASAPVSKTVGRGEGQIGCLLPLSGSARGLGERAMRAVRLVFGADNGRLVVADTAGNPEAAIREFEDLAHNPTVLAVIGPIRGDDAQAVGRRAEDLHVPVLLLSSQDGLSGKFAVPVGVTRDEQITRLLDYAMGRFHLRRFGVIYPKDAADVVATFRNAVERRGGTIVGTTAYPTGATTVRPETATIRKWHERDNLQAVFLPAGPAVAAEFAKFLQQEMPDVTLLGVQGWASLAEPHGGLNGVLFADGFYADSARPGTRAFVGRFQQAYGQTPGVLEADAYDAATLAQRALAKGASSPADMLQVLRGLGPVSGAAGDMTMTPKGLQRTVFLVQVSEGRLDEVGAPAAYALPEAVGAEPAPLLTGTPAADVRGLPPHVGSLQAEPLDAPAKGGAAPAPAAVADGAAAHVKVACVLPLTGPDQAYGKRALAGLRLAFADAPAQLVVRDTGGDPAGTADWLARLQKDPEVVAVVGPLRSTEAEIAAPIAERERLPLLLLSQREGLAGHYVLQVAMTRAQQVRLLVHHVVGALKLRRIGIVYPNDGYGSTFAEAFKREAANEGASIVGTHPYPPGSSNFSSVVVDVRGWQEAGLDALFIPDAAPTATAIAADVRTEMPSVVLLGGESWNDSRSLAVAGSAIDGAIFADAFFVDSARPSTRQFVQQFEQQMGQVPSVFEAQAFDAGMALRRVIAGGATSREQIITDLRALGTFEGAGELRAAPSGFERSVLLLRYHNGQVEEVLAAATEG
jgi:ABC-type branched-subunit amino acid transport system substrate-binding protein